MDQKIVDRLACWSSIFSAASFLATLPLVTGVLLCICLSTVSGTGVCFVALVPLAYTLAATGIPRSTYAAAYLAGLMVHLFGMAWVLDCYSYENVVGPYAVQWFWIGTWGGALFAITFAIGRFIATRRQLPMTLLLPLIWVTYEFVRHEMAEMVTGTGFPWLKLGTAIIDSRYLAQVADLGGEYLLSFLVAMINGAIVDVALAARKGNSGFPRRDKVLAAAASFLVILAALGYGSWRLRQSPAPSGPSVVLMGELDLPPILQPERLQEATKGRRADLLLWPELAYHHAVLDVDSDVSEKSSDVQAFTQVSVVPNPREGKARRYLQHSAKELGSTLVIGCERVHVTKAGSYNYNSLACADPKDGFQGCYDKVNLVPGAEAAMRSAELLDACNYLYHRGQDGCVFRLPSATTTYRFAPAICYDICFGRHFQSSTARHVDFLVQSGAEGQDDSGDVARLMLRYARLRAIENRRALVRNTTFGYSALIDGNGVVQAALPPEPITSPTWLGTVPIDPRWSLYPQWGDWVAHIACFVTICLTVSGRLCRLARREQKRPINRA